MDKIHCSFFVRFSWLFLTYQAVWSKIIAIKNKEWIVISIFEALMFCCFMAAWCVSITKALRTGATGGKSPIFSIILMLGCIAGTVNKLLYRYDGVVYLYMANTILIGVDLALYVRNKKRERLQGENQIADIEKMDVT